MKRNGLAWGSMGDRTQQRADDQGMLVGKLCAPVRRCGLMIVR